jgi:hypothetical protein
MPKSGDAWDIHFGLPDAERLNHVPRTGKFAAVVVAIRN